ncbi:MAG TPA: RagB/SusD family nutrient uptake outer membrane protein [Parasegetibacter sp.]|jgi:hypothetical protein
MNRLILIFCAVTIFLSSCTKFLEETSPSIVIPTKVTHYSELLYGQGYPTQTTGYNRFSELITDDVQWNHLPNPNPLYGPMREYTRKEGWNVFLFQDDPELDNNNGTDYFWGETYKAIAVCNVVIDGLTNVDDTDERLRKHTKGQAHALRAMHYLSLMNMYGMPYVPGTDSEWGVPIKTSPVAEDRLYKRNTVHEVYALIKADIDSALNLIDSEKKMKLYEMNWYAAMIMATRINLYMKNYDEVIRLGEAYLLKKSELPVSTATLTNGTFMGFTASWSGVTTNPEVVFNFGMSPSTYNSVYSASAGYDAFIPSQSLRQVFAKSLKAGESDQRMTNTTGNTASWFFAVASSQYAPRKIYLNNVMKNTLRTGEVLLNLAEAYAEKGNIAKAVTHLNYLRSSRIRNYIGFVPADFNQASLIEFTREERRRELCFEEHRLADLKRWGMPPLEHQVQDYTGKYRAQLQQGDYGYIFQIPLKERQLNFEIKPIPRPQRVIEPI